MSVFLLSRVAHSLVRWNQDPESDVWCITLWYIGQMLPIIIEMIVSIGWAKTRRAVNIREDLIWLNRAEYWVGYLWVTCWFI
jgi:hypothetical protein